MLSQLASLVRLLPILSVAVLVAGQVQDPEAIWTQVRDPSVGEHIRQLTRHEFTSDYTKQQLDVDSMLHGWNAMRSVLGASRLQAAEWTPGRNSFAQSAVVAQPG
jgi:hypothetical protein